MPGVISHTLYASDDPSVAITGGGKVVGIVYGSAGDGNDITACTLNGVAGTLVGTDHSSTGGEEACAAVFAWDDPGAGNYVMSATVGAGIRSLVYDVWELSAALTPTDFALTKAGSASPPATLAHNLSGQQNACVLAFGVAADGGTFGGSGAVNDDVGNLTNHLSEWRDHVIAGSGLDLVAAGDPETYRFEFAPAGAGGGAIDRYMVGVVVVPAAAADTTAPTFSAGPTAVNQSPSGHNIQATIDEDGTLYAVRLPNGATAPTSAQVKAGQDSTGAAAPEAKSVAATGGVQASMTFNTGAETTDYDYYVVAEDDEGTPNIQASPTLVEAATGAAVLTITSVVPSNPKPGDSVTINVSYANANGKTLTYNGSSVTVDTQDANSLTVNSWPYPWDLATPDVDFNTDYTLQVTDGAENDTAQVQTAPATGEDYHAITGKPWPISSIYADDPAALENGDKHWGYWSTGGTGASMSTAGVPSNVSDGDQYTYRLFDTSAGLWGSAATEVMDLSDVSPDQFSFTDQTDLDPGTTLESNEITVLGIDPGANAPISIGGGEFAVDSGGGYSGWGSAPSTVQLNHKVKVRGTSPAGYGAKTDVTLNVGGVTDVFSLINKANQAPILSGNISDQSSNLGAVISFDISAFFTDTPGDTLTYSVSAGALPNGLSLNTNTGEITGVLGLVEVQGGIVITASDGELSVNSNAFSWTVSSNVTNTPASGQPTIAGTAQEGQTLVADTANIVDPDGFGPFSYQWQRGTTNIAGANGVTYALTAADVGHTIRVIVSFTDGSGFSESVISNNTSVVAALGINTPATGIPVILGTAQVGQTLSVDTSAIADLEGLGAFSYQWQRGAADIVGATGATYSPVAGDVGSTLRVLVSFTDGQGNAESVTSANTAVVVDIPVVVAVRDMVDLPDVEGSGFDVPKYKQFVGEEWPYSWDFSDQATKRSTTIQSVTWESVGAVPVTISYPQMNGDLALAVVSGESRGPAIVRVTCRYANAQDRIRFFKISLDDEAIA